MKLGVNHNMRYDQSMRALKTLLDRGELGEPVVAEIVMNARPHWQEFIKPLRADRAPEHVDPPPRRVPLPVRRSRADRRLACGPTRATTSRTSDGLAFYILEYGDGLRGDRLDNCFTWVDHRIEWRVEGTEGIAKGTIGWPDYPEGSPSTIDWTTRAMEGAWERPRWEERWFPQAFKGTMGQLMRAIQEDSEPEISGRTTIGTMALVEAAYRSAEEGRAVSPHEVLPEAART